MHEYINRPLTIIKG